MVNGAHDVWVDRGEGLARIDIELGGDAAIRRLAQRFAARCGRRLDDAQPWVDAWLPDGTRLHAVLPPIATRGVCLSLRVFPAHARSFAELSHAGTIPPRAAELIHQILSARLAFLITGGTASGKTTLLAALLGEVSGTERIITVEDAAELRPNHPHVVGLQAEGCQFRRCW